MRLIDADKINFEEVFGGQSDFAKDLRKAAQELIDSQPTAFDKEKVVSELQEAKELDVYVPLEDALEIIRKGGIKEE